MPNITAAQLNQIIADRRGQLPGTAYMMRVYDARITVEYGDFQVGQIRFTTQGARVDVETINVNDNRQGRGLGKLLVAALCAYAQAHAIANMGLGTLDTSGGFWARYGVGQGGNTAIALITAQIFGPGHIVIT